MGKLVLEILKIFNLFVGVLQQVTLRIQEQNCYKFMAIMCQMSKHFIHVREGKGGALSEN